MEEETVFGEKASIALGCRQRARWAFPPTDTQRQGLRLLANGRQLCTSGRIGADRLMHDAQTGVCVPSVLPRVPSGNHRLVRRLLRYHMGCQSGSQIQSLPPVSQPLIFPSTGFYQKICNVVGFNPVQSASRVNFTADWRTHVVLKLQLRGGHSAV